MKTLLLLTATIAISLGTLQARTWKSADGSKTFEGEFRSFNEKTGKVSVVINGRAMEFSQELPFERRIANTLRKPPPKPRQPSQSTQKKLRKS